MDKRFVIELGKILLNPKKIVIIPHRNPDGDALGSTLALKHFLVNKGHEAFVISPNDYPNFLKFLPGESEILKYSSTPKEVRNKIRNAELIFTLDFNSLSRAQDLTEIIQNSSGKKIMIDHHEAPEDIELYFCGPPLMNQAVLKMAEDWGIPDENVRFDDFGG